MNIDANILNKIAAKRIQQRIKRTNEHVGFIPGMQGSFNIQKSINVIHHINNMKEERKKVFICAPKDILENVRSSIIGVVPNWKQSKCPFMVEKLNVF